MLSGGVLATPASGQGDPPPSAPAPDHPADDAAPTIVVTARRLDTARTSIAPSLGASSYAVSQAAIAAMPGGDDQSLNQLVLQAPGVAQDGFGQVHVRDDHGDLQYRVNGTILPEGLAVFGQTLSPRLIDHFALLTGALPAQYGLRTAGVVDITTKSGEIAPGGTASLYAGSHDTFAPSLAYGGSTASTNYFASLDYRHDALGIESVDGSANPLHDATDQWHAFVYADHTLDANNRVSFLGGFANQWFQIPDPSGLHANASASNPCVANPGSPCWQVGGVSDYLSQNLDETQRERTGFGQFTWLHDAGDVSLQASVSARYSELVYRPSVLGELLFNGMAQAAFKSDMALSGQFDGVWKAGGGHTLRFGLYLQRDHTASLTTTQVFPVDGSGNQAGAPIAIADNSTHNALTTSAYLQDEWRLSPRLTLNAGARYDRFAGYRTEDQLSPRASLVWKAGGTAIHAGYARYFSPPPFELVASTALAEFAGTSAAAPAGAQDTTPFAERQNYVDIGIEQRLARGFSIGVDGYYRFSRNLIDEGQFGAPIILTPFNYHSGRIVGVEFTASYQRGGWMAYGNLALARAMGQGIVSSQFNFSADDLAWIASHAIHLDHDQTLTGSGGISYTVRQGRLKGLKLGGDMLYGSGLRSDLVLPGGDVPNGRKLPAYAQLNLSTSYRLSGPGVELRLDIINLADARYQLRDGTGVGVGAPQWGARRGVFIALSKDL